MGEDFLLHVFKSKCEFQVKVNVTATEDVEAGVRKMVELILKHLEQSCPEFAVADIIPTGSFYEGTKIGAPDEFDFMLTLAKLSGTDKISLQPGCSEWYPHILNYNQRLNFHNIIRLIFVLMENQAKIKTS